MVVPIEVPPSSQLELFTMDNPQQEALSAFDYERFLDATSAMECRCCGIGEKNCGAPPVVCDGNIRGKIMLIGEAPGRTEREKGIPFVGMAGTVLSTMLLDARIPDHAVYKCNVLKCRPFDEIRNKENITQVNLKDRKPSEDEVAACFPLLRKQISFTLASYYIFLGGTAATACLGLRPAFKVLDHIGFGLPLVVGGRKALGLTLPHPSYFLHNKRDDVRYQRAVDVFRSVRIAIESRGARPIVFTPIPELEFLSRHKPAFYERGAA